MFSSLFKQNNDKKGWKEIFPKKQLVLIFSFFLTFCLFLFFVFFTGNKRESSKPVEILINHGESFASVTENLYQQKVIPNKLPFKIAGFLFGIDRKIKAGRYLIPDNLSYTALAGYLNPKNCDPLIIVNFYNGISLKGIVNRLKGQKIVTGDSLQSMLFSKELANEYGIEGDSFEGYVLPGDYLFFQNSNLKEVIQKLFSKFNEYYNDSIKAKCEEAGISKHKLLTLASIIQGETNEVSELPIIAGIYFNRLKKDIKLESCPTVQYVLPGGWKARLSDKDTQIESPYNTYKHKGLPPGPVSNPGKAAMAAVLSPATHNFLFLCASKDGKHKFSSTYAEHLSYAREYHQWLNSQNIK